MTINIFQIYAVCVFIYAYQIYTVHIYTVFHRSEYTTDIFVNILLYLLMWKHWRNDTLLQCKVVSVQFV